MRLYLVSIIIARSELLANGLVVATQNLRNLQEAAVAEHAQVYAWQELNTPLHARDIVAARLADKDLAAIID